MSVRLFERELAGSYRVKPSGIFLVGPWKRRAWGIFEMGKEEDLLCH